MTDEAGNYSLTIPDSLFKNQTLTQSGNFNIYYAFYLYNLDSVQILTDNKGFIPGMKDIDGQGQVKSVILEQFLDIKSGTDKAIYQPDDTLWVELTLTNLSNHPIEVVFYDQGMGYSISEITLYADNALWYFLAQGSFAEERENLNPGQSLDRSCRYLLKSITEPRWRITFPWQCRVKPAGFNILSRQSRLPKKLRNVIHELGWPYGDYLADYFTMPTYYKLLKNKFVLAQITITM